MGIAWVDDGAAMPTTRLHIQRGTRRTAPARYGRRSGRFADDSNRWSGLHIVGGENARKGSRAGECCFDEAIADCALATRVVVPVEVKMFPTPVGCCVTSLSYRWR
jgi:hypothetical protein